MRAAHRYGVIGLIGAVAWSAGCRKTDDFSGSLNTPAPLAVLDPALGGPFDDPVGYVADTHGGRVRALDLARGTYLTDDPAAAFYPGSRLSLGAARIPAGIAAASPSPDRVHLLVADRAHRQLAVVPHVVGVANGAPIEATPRLGEVTVDDRDASGGDLRATVQVPRLDQATDETWTFTFTSGLWRAEGSRSGKQRKPAATNGWWTPDQPGVLVLIEGDATPGDRITVEVDIGVQEVDLPGTPEALALAPDGQRAALSLSDDDGGGALWWVDAATGALDGEITLAGGALPRQLAWSADGATLYVADLGLAGAWAVDAASGVATFLPAGFPVIDVAPLEGDAGPRLFLARADRAEVWVMDPTTATFIDVNVSTPDVDGMVFLSPVRGLAPIHAPYQLPRNALGERTTGRSVAVSLASGAVVFMSEERGCLVPDGLGPRTVRTSQINPLGDYEPSFDAGGEEPYLEPTEDSRHHVIVNACAGVAPTESWRLRYDTLAQGWRAEGSLSGPQEALVREDVRYLSDTGAVSLWLRSGTLPSTDEMNLRFDVEDGVLEANGAQPGSTVRDVNVDLPARPMVYTAPWFEGDHPFVVVAAQAADIVVAFNPTDGRVTWVWE